MSFFVPSVHVGRSKPFDPDDPFSGRLPFSASRRRPKRKKPPVPCTCNIPYICQIILISSTGFLILLSGVGMSVLGYYPGYFAGERVLNGTSFEQNKLVYYHIRNLAFVGPILMGIGCFAIIIAGVVYFEFRDKYFLDLPQDEIKSMPKQVVRNMLVDQFRHNYFRGIPIPFMTPEQQAEQEYKMLHKDSLQDKENATKPASNTRKGSSVSMMDSLAPMVRHELPGMQKAHSTTTLPTRKPAVILSPINLVSISKRNVNDGGLDRGSLANVFRLAPSSLSSRSSTTGVENPAYLSDDDSDKTGSDQCDLENSSDVFSPDISTNDVCASGTFSSSVIVHAASIHFPSNDKDFLGTSDLQNPKVNQSFNAQRQLLSSKQRKATYKSCPTLQEIRVKPNYSSPIPKKRAKSFRDQTNSDKTSKRRLALSHGDLHKLNSKTSMSKSVPKSDDNGSYNVTSDRSRQKNDIFTVTNGNECQLHFLNENCMREECPPSQLGRRDGDSASSSTVHCDSDTDSSSSRKTNSKQGSQIVEKYTEPVGRVESEISGNNNVVT